MIQGGQTVIKGIFNGELVTIAVDVDGNIIALMKGFDGTDYQPIKVDTYGQLITILKGASGVDVNVDTNGYLTSVIHGDVGAVAQDATGSLIAKVQGSQNIDVLQKATGELITEIIGSSGNAVAQDGSNRLMSAIYGDQGLVAQDTNNKLISVMQGSESIAVKQKAITGELQAELNGSEGLPIKQKAISGELQAELLGSQSLPIAQKAVTGELIAELIGSAGNPISQDSNDRLEAALYGNIGLVAQDGSNRLMSAIYGSNGLIAQDSSNNLISVMKGNYNGSLQTWKVDSEGRGEMYIADLQDPYGNINEMGLGELANRTHAPPILYDKRGTVLYFDDFEDSIHGAIITTGSATGLRSTDTAKTKLYSLKLTTNNLFETVFCNYYLTDFHENKIGTAASFASGTSNRQVSVSMRYFNNSNEYRAEIVLDLAAKTISYYNSAGSFVVLASNINYYPSIHNWATLKLVIDLNTKNYERLIAFGVEYDLSSQSINSTVNTTAKRVQIIHGVTTLTGGAIDSYIDNVLITENEPAN